MEVFKRAFVALVLVIFALQHSISATEASPFPQSNYTATLLSQTTTSSSIPFHYNVTQKFNRTSNESKFTFRKCCAPGQVYHVDKTKIGNNRCISYSITSQASSSLIEIPRPLFLTADQNSLQYAAEDLAVKEGFPQDCNPDSVLLLEPDVLMADRFYPVKSGQLVVPHRFWFFQPEDHCIEEFFKDEDFNKAKKIAFICTDRINTFPTNAIDEAGKLQLDFIESNASNELSAITGQTVVRKCCDINEVFSLDNRACIPDQQGHATQFFDELRAREHNQLFFRIGLLNCAYQRNTMKFQLTSSGSLQVDTDVEGLSWSGQLFSANDYCVDDFVVTSSVGLPETINLAYFCLEDPSELLDIDSPSVPVDSGTISEIHYEELMKINAPKCCSSSEVVDGTTCQTLQLFDQTLDAKSIVSNALNFYLLDNFNISSTLVSNASLSCGFGTRHPMISNAINGSEGTVKFKPLGDGDKLSLSMHLYVENYWDFDVTLHSFCVDLALLRSVKEAAYQPQVFYCITSSHVSEHYPILLCISTAALLATFIIYFLVPTSGSAKLVTSMGNGTTRKKTIPTMAMMLTGRILLCHVLMLAVTFTALTISQLEKISPGQSSCTALGFIIYGASMASFSWLTVYCFDYCRIFRGSFKVSNEILFVPYSAFGWGVPILALIAASVGQFQSTHLGISGNINPNMGLLRCWFAGGTSSLVFFYMPVSVMILLNVIFFLSLLFNPNLMNCWKRNQGLSLRTNRNTQKKSKERQDVKMAIKLFFITGIPWVFEIIAWLPTYLPDVQPILRDNSVYFLEVSNLLNSLRGVIVFVIFIIMQRDVRRYMWLRLKRVFSSTVNSKLNVHSRTNAGSISASTTQQSFSTRLSSYFTSRLTPSASTSEGEEQNSSANNQNDCDNNDVTYL